MPAVVFALLLLLLTRLVRACIQVMGVSIGWIVWLEWILGDFICSISVFLVLGFDWLSKTQIFFGVHYEKKKAKGSGIYFFSD